MKFNGSAEDFDSDEEDDLAGNWNDGMEQVSDNEIQQQICHSVSKARKLVRYFRKSIRAKELFKQQDGIVQETLPIDIKTRWSSTLAMLQRIVEFDKQIENVIMLLLQEVKTEAEREKLRSLVLDMRDKDIMQRLINVLVIFEEATRLLSGQENPTTGMAYVTLIGLKKFLSNENDQENAIEAKLKRSLLEKLLMYTWNSKSFASDIHFYKCSAVLDNSLFASSEMDIGNLFEEINHIKSEVSLVYLNVPVKCKVRNDK